MPERTPAPRSRPQVQGIEAARAFTVARDSRYSGECDICAVRIAGMGHRLIFAGPGDRAGPP